MALPVNLNNLKSNEGSNLARKHDALVEFVRALVINPGVGYQVSISPLGTILRIKPAKQASSPHPFQLVDATEGEQKKIRVRFGVVNSEIPSGMSEGDDPPYVLDVPGNSGVVYLVVTTNNFGDVTSVTIGIGSSLPTNGGSTFYHPIGTYSVDEDNNLHLAQAISGSQAFQLCGGVTALWGLV